MLKIYLLGQPRVELNGEALHFKLRNAEALFYYLVMLNLDPAAAALPARDRGALAALLWPETLEQVARRNLRDVIYSLRQTVGEFVQATHSSVAWDREADYWLDAAQFAALRPLLLQQPLDASRVAELLALYRGEFLAGFYVSESAEYEHWLGVERERFQASAVQAMQRLTDHYSDARQLTAGLEQSQRLLALDSANEYAHRQRMRLLALDGQRSAALAQYETCRRILAETFGVDPAPETQALYAQIRAGAPLMGGPAPQPAIPAAPAIPVPPPPPRNNLPRALTPFFGRKKRLKELAAKISAAEYPLLTITGPGGVGKTRLALAAAAQAAPAFEDGAWFVNLVEVSCEPEEKGDAGTIANNVATAVAAALEIPLKGPAPASDQVCAALAAKRLLLILDNFEHLMPAAGFVLTLLQQAPAVKVVVTSRERLNLQAEAVLTLGGLGLPDETAVAQALAQQPPNLAALQAGYSGLALFVERAQRQAAFELTAANLPVVVQIGRLVGGLPLALELAAAQTPFCAVAELAERIQEKDDVLATQMADVPARQRSMRAVFETSWRLLTPEEQRVLAQCSAFRLDFPEAAATAVTQAAPAVLAALVAKSLLWIVAPGRYALHSVLRGYIARKLDAQPALRAYTRRRHAQFFFDYLSARTEQIYADTATIEAVRMELDNLRAAWEWAIAAGDVRRLGQAGRALFGVYQHYGLFYAAREMLQAATDALRQDAQAQDAAEARLVLGNLLVTHSFFTERLGDLETAVALIEEARALGQQLDDAELLASAHLRMGSICWVRGQVAQVGAHSERGLALARQVHSARLEATALSGLGLVALAQKQPAEAVRYQEAAAAVAEKANLLRLASSIYINLAHSHARLGDIARVQRYYQAALAIYQRMGNVVEEGAALTGLARLALIYGQPDEARRLAETARRHFDSVGVVWQGCTIRIAFSNILMQQARYDEAYEWARAALDTAVAHRLQPLQARALLAQGNVVLAWGQAPEALAVFRQAAALVEAGDPDSVRLAALAGQAEALRVQGQVANALALVNEMYAELETLSLLQSPEIGRATVFSYRVLRAGDDARAARLLERGVAALQAQAAALPDAQRAAFLHGVPVHHELLAAFEQGAAARSETGRSSEAAGSV
jgi:DNA-binding SARP family transcriptional activator/predicted ATPase